MKSWSHRVGAWAGWIALVGILVMLVVLPSAIAGPPPVAVTDMTVVRGYFAHPELAWLLGLANTFLIVAVLPFGIALRERLSSTAAARSFSTLGLGFLVIASGIYLTQGAVAAALVQVSRDGGDLGGLFRFYDVLYNSAGDILEGSWVLGFSLGMASQAGPFPRWVAALGVIVGVSRWGKAVVPFIGPVPAAVPMVLGVLFFAWFAASVIGLTRSSAEPARDQLAASLGQSGG